MPGGHAHAMDASADYANIILGDHPTAYYRLDGTGTTAADSSGNTYNGTVGASVTEGVAGLIAGSDTAMQFSGVKSASGLVTFPRTSALEPTSKVTLEAWIRFSAIPASWTGIAAYGSDRSAAPYMLAFQYSGKPLATFSTTAGVLNVVSPTALAPNTTYHLVGTYDGTTGRLYVNGTQVASGTISGTLNNYYSTYGFTIGDDAYPDDPPFIGTIDEVAVYAGTVLTPAQIQNHYTAGTTGGGTTPTPAPSPTPTPAPTPTPVQNGSYSQTIINDAPAAYYHLDDTGPTANDASGHAHSGTIGTSITESAPGLIPTMNDTAMSFPGVKSTAGLVTFPRASALEPAKTVTIEAWIRFSAVPASWTALAAYGSDRSAAPYMLAFQYSGKPLVSFSTTAGALNVISATALSPNTTYHLVGTYDGTTGRLYVNGAQVATGTLSGALNNYYGTYGFTIGDDAYPDDPPFVGKIDEVAVYTKVLSATQIQNHYIAGTTGGGATPTPNGPATDWLSFGYDLQRSGYNPNETLVGSGNVSSLQQVWTFNVGSSTVHEPVYAAGVNVNGTSTNIIYAGSQWGSTMYAINAATGGIVWQDAVPSASFNCGTGSSSQFSIGETPAIDRAKNLLYFADGQNQLHAVDLATGKETNGWPITIATYTPVHNFLHGGLTYNPANGLLYAVTGSTCDISPWYGRIVAINTAGPGIAGTFFPMSGTSAQGSSGGGIWGPGGGSIVQNSGNVVIATGNADTTLNSSQHASYAEQIVELSSTLGTIVANNYPTSIPVLSGFDDFDFGATPLLFQPPGCPLMVAAENKSGMFEVYDEATISSGPVQSIAMSVPSDEASFVGAPAYDPVTNYVYVGMPSTSGIYRPGLAAFSIASNCTLNTTPVWSANFGPDAASGGQAPRSPISIANGVVYVGNYTGNTLYAFNAASGAQVWSVALSSWGNVGTVIANGMVYVGAADGTIRAYAVPGQAAILRKSVVKTPRSFIPVHHSRPRTAWSWERWPN